MFYSDDICLTIIRTKLISDKSGAITRNEKQTKQLEEKQKQFKIAAVKAKQNGNMEAAKEYLKKAKQIQTLIDRLIL